MSAEGRRYSVWHWIGPAIIGVLLVLALAALVSVLWTSAHQPKIVEPPPAPLAMLMRPIPDGPNAALLRHGRYLVAAGDCVSCHTREGGRPFNGGLGLNTPFGVIYSPDITGNRQTGIGNWSDDQFFRALNQGGGRHASLSGIPISAFLACQSRRFRGDPCLSEDYSRTALYAAAERLAVSARSAHERRGLAHAVLSRTSLPAGDCAIGGLESRRLSCRRVRPLRRLSHTEGHVRRGGAFT
jgi:hypothetical protein